MAELNEKSQNDTEKVSSEKNVKKKNKKPNIFQRIGKFFRECKSEMKKVTWLSGKETFKSSVIVVVVTLALCVAIGLIDTALEYGVVGLRDLTIHLGLNF
ncbi:MAG: preprotein translocase subunit SecE [Ruminococcaceae bacterium]|nr:preprotein translocase subunit SecE [Oscillospiraceae bacterium]